MSRGDRREDIFFDDVDRQDFLKTVAEACLKADFLVHAYCMMSNHFHLVIETPNANLVAGMRWLLSSYTLRLNHRRKLTGHVFSGRYKAVVVDGSGDGYLKTVCDYVHLNPARANLLGREDRLWAYPWSSLPWYLAARDHRPAWMRTERLLGAHGIREDSAAGRQQFEERMEWRRKSEAEDAEWEPLKRGWCIGSEEFKRKLLEKIDENLGEHHSGELRRESADVKAERILQEELQRLGWTPGELALRRKGDPAKLAIAHRLRRETVLPMTAIAAKLHLGSPKSARARLREQKARGSVGVSASRPSNSLQSTLDNVALL
jgi:putative transposase